MNEEGYLTKMFGLHMEKEEKEVLEIRGCNWNEREGN